MIQTIITHPGGAHKDDVLAVSVLIAKYSAPVFRREPTEQELADPTIAIVDIGNEHEPQKANFDHHHFPREHPPTCSLSLVLQHLGLYEDALQFCEWLEPAEWLDSRGPNKTADWLGVPRKAISQLNSPIDVTLLRRFAKKTTLEAGDPLYEFMRFVGQDLLDYLHLVRERIEFAKQHVEHWSIPCGDETIEALHMPRTEPETEEPRAAQRVDLERLAARVDQTIKGDHVRLDPRAEHASQHLEGLLYRELLAARAYEHGVRGDVRMAHVEGGSAREHLLEHEQSSY